MRVAFFAPVLIAALTIASVAPAQRLGTRIGKNAGVEDGRDAAQMMAECWAARQPAKAVRWMDIVPGSPDEQTKIFADLREFETCMHDDKLVLDDKSLRFKPPAMRRPVAIALAQDALRRRPIPTTAPVLPTLAWFKGKMSSSGGYDAAALSMQAFGQCVAIADWSHSIAMLRALPNSENEIAAFKALVPVLGPCIPEGERVTLTRPIVRQVLAEPVYHLMAASGGGKQ